MTDRLDIDQDPESGALLLRCRGRWVLAEGVPSLVPVEAALARRAPSRVAFADAGLEGWDSALTAWALGAGRLAEARGAAVDYAGLPEGAQALLGLARANAPRGARGGAPRERGPLAALGRLAHRTQDEATATLGFLGEVTGAFGRLLRGRAQFGRGDLGALLRETGVEALPVAALISFLVGAILAFVGAVQLQTFGAQVFVADLVGLAMARDIGAIMTAIVIAGRTGAAFAATIGTMQGAEEVDALRTMSLDPVDVLALPRVLALILMTPFLVLYSGIIGILGGAVVGVTLPDVTLPGYWARTVEALTLGDFAGGLFKGTVYGALVAFAGTMRGMQCGRSAADVGAATTSAVVTGIVYVIAAAALLTMIFHVLEI